MKIVTYTSHRYRSDVTTGRPSELESPTRLRHASALTPSPGSPFLLVSLPFCSCTLPLRQSQSSLQCRHQPPQTCKTRGEPSCFLIFCSFCLELTVHFTLDMPLQLSVLCACVFVCVCVGRGGRARVCHCVCGGWGVCVCVGGGAVGGGMR